MPESYPWRRGLVEAVLVLVSILLAFWIDAWWEGRRAIRLESGILRDLAGEMERNHSDLDSTLGTTDLFVDRMDRFLRATPDELARLPRDSVRQLAVALLRAPTFDPHEASASVLLQTPMTRSEASLRIRALVSDWRNVIDDAEENRALLNTASSNVAERLSHYVTARPSGSVIPTLVDEIGPAVLAQLRGDNAFVASVIYKVDAHATYIRELGFAGTALDSLAGVLRRRVAQR